MRRIAWPVASVLAAGLAAQHRIWVVDRQNRPGTDFLDLQVAVDQVPLGDILDVRDGDYHYWDFIVRRGITIQFRPGAFLQRSLMVSGLPAGQNLSIGALQSGTSAGVPTEVSYCEGTVAFANCATGWLRIRNSRNVTLTGGSSQTIDAVDSTVALSGCHVVGIDQGPPPWCLFGLGALIAERSRVTIDASRLAPGWIEVSCPRWNQGPTIGLLDSSTVYVTRGSEIRDGFSGALSGAANAGVVVLDPSIGPLRQNPELRVERRVVPALQFATPVVGQVAAGAVYAAGALGACGWLGGPIAAVPLPGLGGVWAVDPLQSILFLCGVPQNGVLPFSIAVPADPILVGEIVALQGLAWLPAMTVTTWRVELVRG